MEGWRIIILQSFVYLIIHSCGSHHSVGYVVFDFMVRCYLFYKSIVFTCSCFSLSCQGSSCIRVFKNYLYLRFLRIITQGWFHGIYLSLVAIIQILFQFVSSAFKRNKLLVYLRTSRKPVLSFLKATLVPLKNAQTIVS